ncbi:MAG: hypothetical protein O6913_02070 [Chloroflexi bacterium]|nr:hypothetical protein [Chloroflexota bacterium]
MPASFTNTGTIDLIPGPIEGDGVILLGVEFLNEGRINADAQFLFEGAFENANFMRVAGVFTTVGAFLNSGTVLVPDNRDAGREGAFVWAEGGFVNEGLLNAEGPILLVPPFENPGTIRVAVNFAHVGSEPFTNAGRIELVENGDPSQPAILFLEGPLVNMGTLDVQGPGAIFAPLDNPGYLRIAAEVAFSEPFTNTGTVEIDGDPKSPTGVVFEAGFVNDGLLDVRTPAAIFSLIENSGLVRLAADTGLGVEPFTNLGTIEINAASSIRVFVDGLVVNAGVIDVQTPAFFSVVELENRGVLNVQAAVELDGALMNTGDIQLPLPEGTLLVGGSVSLAGSLTVVGGETFDPTSGEFVVMAYADRVGDFDAVVLPALPADRLWETSVLDTSYQFTIVAANGAPTVDPGTDTDTMAGDREVVLSRGWNAVTYTGPTLATTELGRFVRVYDFVLRWNRATQDFDDFAPCCPIVFNTLGEIHSGDALWLKMATPAVWEMPIEPASASVPLAAGWNFVAWQGPTARAADALAALGPRLLRAFAPIPGSTDYLVYAPTLPPTLNTLQEIPAYTPLWLFIGTGPEISWPQELQP